MRIAQLHVQNTIVDDNRCTPTMESKLQQGPGMHLDHRVSNKVYV